VQDVEAAPGLPLSSSASGAHRREMILEVNYDIQVFHGVNIEPDFSKCFGLMPKPASATPRCLA
jgi:hypothetical protein